MSKQMQLDIAHKTVPGTDEQGNCNIPACNIGERKRKRPAF